MSEYIHTRNARKIGGKNREMKARYHKVVTPPTPAGTRVDYVRTIVSNAKPSATIIESVYG